MNMPKQTHDNGADAIPAPPQEICASEPQDDNFKHVCHGCIGDEFLAEEVKTKGTSAPCSYCGETREAVTLETLAGRVHEALTEHFYLTLGYPSEPYEYFQASEHDWERKGDQVKDALSDLAQINGNIAADVVKLLSDEYGYCAVKEGQEDPYGLEAMYEQKSPDSSFFQRMWEVFCDDITFSSRFLSTYAEGTLAEIFGALGNLTTFGDDPVIREFNPDNENSFFWRGRTALSDQELEHILKFPTLELGPPPPGKTKAGRMNAEGIPVFYGAMERSTCVSEVRAPVGSRVVVGKFALLRQVRLLDLNALAKAYVEGSYFDPNYARQIARLAFFKRLVAEVSRPVMPQDEALEYIPTQVVAEYLAKNSLPNLDGIIFRSPQSAGIGRNVVLFNHACFVMPYEVPKGTEVQVSIRAGYQDDEEYDDDTVFVWETVPSNQHGDELPDEPGWGEQGPMLLPMGYRTGIPTAPLDPTLRLDVNSVEILNIKGTTYDFGSNIVLRNRQTREERDALNQRMGGTDIDLDSILDTAVMEEPKEQL